MPAGVRLDTLAVDHSEHCALVQRLVTSAIFTAKPMLAVKACVEQFEAFEALWV